MKKRASNASRRDRTEFKGVVKKITGKLTSNPALEKEGRAEMLGHRSAKRNGTNPDPHRRG